MVHWKVKIDVIKGNIGLHEEVGCALVSADMLNLGSGHALVY